MHDFRKASNDIPGAAPTGVLTYLALRNRDTSIRYTLREKLVSRQRLVHTRSGQKGAITVIDPLS